MANFVPKLGLHNNLPNVKEGSFLITTDEREIYVDTNTGRKLISSGKQEIEYIIGTQNEPTSAWTGNTKDDALYTGKIIAYQLPQSGTVSAATLQLTYPSGQKSNAISVMRQNAAVTMHYPAHSVIFLVYDGTVWRTDGDYNSEPVSSVNQKTGHVILNASDVGALADDTFIPTKTSDLTNDAGFITQADVIHQTYNARNGIEITSSGWFQHTNSVTSVSTYPSGTTANANGGSFTVRDVQYDAQGHITSSTPRTITLSQYIPTISDLNGIDTITTGSVSAPLTLSANKSGTTVTIGGSIAAASTTAAGVVQLSSSTSSDSNTMAATPAAVKAAYNLANNYSGTVKSITPGSGLVNAATGDDSPITNSGTIQLAGVTTSSSTSTTAPASQGTFTVVDDITTNSFGQVTNINTKTVTLPAGAVYQFADNYNASTNKGATVATVTNAINDLDVTAITGTAAQTITSISETNGKVSATYSNIAISGTQISTTSIPNDRLVNSTIGIAGTNVALGSSISTSDLRSNLGLSQALTFKGVTSANVTDGSTTIPTDLGIANYTPSVGDVIIDSNTTSEFIWVKGTGFTSGRWERLGPDSSFKVLQSSAVASPTTNGAATEFIDTISQNINGDITATKKYIPVASSTTTGLLSNDLYDKIVGMASGATANSGTVRSVTMNVTTGLTINSTAAITDTGTRTIGLDTVGTSGTYGETAQQTPAHSSAFNVPYFTVDEYGRVTSAGVATVKLPSAGSNNKVTQSAATTATGEYPVILAYSTSTAAVTNSVNKTSTLTYNPGTQVLTAPTFSGNFSGTATKVSHKLTIGSYEFDGSADVTIPIYAGATL